MKNQTAGEARMGQLVMAVSQACVGYSMGEIKEVARIIGQAVELEIAKSMFRGLPAGHIERWGTLCGVAAYWLSDKE